MIASTIGARYLHIIHEFLTLNITFHEFHSISITLVESLFFKIVKTHCSKTNFTLHFMFNILLLVNVENIIYLCCRYCLACVTIATCVFLWLRTLAMLSPVVRATQVM